MRRTLVLAVTLMLAGVTVSGCHYGHPGYPSDHHHDHDHGYDHDHGHDHY